MLKLPDDDLVILELVHNPGPGRRSRQWMTAGTTRCRSAAVDADTASGAWPVSIDTEVIHHYKYRDPESCRSPSSEGVEEKD
jgi:hypothetical protein